MRKLILALLTGALIAGCGGQDPDKVAEGDRLPPADDPVAWAGRVCSALSLLSGTTGPALDPNNPAASKDALARSWADTEQRIGESLRGLDAAGPSPIPGGDDTARQLRDALNGLRGAFADARTELDGIDPKDPAALATRLTAIKTRLDVAHASTALSSMGDNAALNEAVKKAPSCAVTAR